MTTPSTRRMDLLTSPMRRRIMDLLANLPAAAPGEPPPARSAAQLAEQLEIHVTTARFHLDLLARHELVESAFVRGGVGRPRKVYRLPQRPITSAVASEEVLAALSTLLAQAWPDPHRSDPSGQVPTPEQIGERWVSEHAPRATEVDREPARTAGAWLGKVGRTLDLLERWGYRPEVRTVDDGRTAELTLVGCPLLDVARATPDVVCGIHRGLLRGALRAVGEAEADVGLAPFVTPDTCRARITTRTGFDSSRP